MHKQQTRCVNIDWLEVHCLEPLTSPRHADYFRSLGYFVTERDYGTRVYAEMFILDDADGQPFIEVRRSPKSTGTQGIHQPNECHLRLTNRTCYLDNAANVLAEFIMGHGYEFRRISRVDICLDFEKFDFGDDPAKFVERYLAKKFRKINQCNLTAHGSETWNDLTFNSVSWGSLHSDIGTKMYNKTFELYDPHSRQYKKPYIRQAWALAGLIDSVHDCKKIRPDGTTYTPQIWRVEFSIRSSVRRWFLIEKNGKPKDFQSIHNTLDMYDSRPKLLTMFASLAQHYFHFKYALRTYDFYKTGDTQGNMRRKDRCPDKLLFDWTSEQYFYKLDTERLLAAQTRQNPFMTLLAKLQQFRMTHSDMEARRACDYLIKYINDETQFSDLNNPFSRAELQAMQWAIGQRIAGNRTEINALLREFKALMHLNDGTAPF